jgi:hypothetical protein
MGFKAIDKCKMLYLFFEGAPLHILLCDFAKTSYCSLNKCINISNFSLRFTLDKRKRVNILIDYREFEIRISSNKSTIFIYDYYMKGIALKRVKMHAELIGFMQTKNQH